jgi:Zn-dependent peptidase ImmA (M78 family)/transcriptional regulator with XRE-family HTH domain
MIYGERIRQVREYHGLKQIALANLLGVDQSTVARIEAGELTPSEQHLLAIALRTGFPVSFFRKPPGPEFPLGSLLFRAHASATATQKAEAHRRGQVWHEVTHFMLSKVRAIPVTLPRLTGMNPAEAARRTRSALGLSPDTAVGNLVHVLEKAGVLIIALPNHFDYIDAFSAWTGEEERRPVILISTGKPGERLRMSIAHDTGHLVLHSASPGMPKDIEDEGFAFAGELLLPAKAMHEQMIRPVTLTTLARLKARWGVSIQALIQRALALNIITYRQRSYLFEQLSAQQWRVAEPVFVPVEKPRAVRKMAEVLYPGSPIDYKKLATDVSLNPQLVKELLDAHATKTELPRRRRAG